MEEKQEDGRTDKWMDGSIDGRNGPEKIMPINRA